MGGGLIYTYKRKSSSKKSNSQTDFEVNQTYDLSMLSWDFRSKRSRQYHERKDRERLNRSGYKLKIGTLEGSIYSKGPSQSTWNTVE